MLFVEALFLALVACVSAQEPIAGFRPPSVPLINFDPYMNIWSMAENLYDTWPQYWDGTIKAFSGLIRVDGDTYRFMGPNSDQVNLGTVTQTSVTVWPIRTIYEFQDPGQRVQLTVQFTTPFLPQQWDISSRPVTYITYTVATLDGASHSVQLYYDNTAEIAVNTVDQEVTWERLQVDTSIGTAAVMQIGTVSQAYFDVRGDGVGIDWGYAYAAVVEDGTTSTAIAGAVSARTQFISDGTIPTSDDTNKPRPVQDDWPVLAIVWNFDVDGNGAVSKFVTFAYDDYYSIEYFGDRFQPYWRRPSEGATIESLLQSAINDYSSILQQCEQHDTQLVAQMQAKVSAEYATLGALAYRQTYAATKIVWNDKLQMPWIFLKEISSAGDINTIDVTAPASTLFLYFDPSYLEYILLPVLAYSNNETGDAQYAYTDAWAPHHLGTYPVADIVTSQQEDMPMEETGDILIMFAAIYKMMGSDSINLWYPKYYPLLKGWADYLVSTLPDPGDQLCTDDFEGPSPHNANLAIKGIVGLGAFSQLATAVGQGSDSSYYYDQAVSFAGQWVDLALDGDHYKLQYDLSGTWSLKYNLFFEKFLGLSLFPADVVPTEMSYYLNNHLNLYGVPLDNRATFTKLDWNAWVATMSNDFDQTVQIFDVLYNWAHNTRQMTPLVDWYDTISGDRSGGFTARPVVGGLYSIMLV